MSAQETKSHSKLLAPFAIVLRKCYYSFIKELNQRTNPKNTISLRFLPNKKKTNTRSEKNETSIG